jgi:hypothetical protein
VGVLGEGGSHCKVMGSQVLNPSLCRPICRNGTVQAIHDCVPRRVSKIAAKNTRFERNQIDISQTIPPKSNKYLDNSK